MALATLSVGANAQSQPATDPKPEPKADSVPAKAVQDKADIATLETVTITAGKREQKARDIAGTVSVLGGAQLEEMGVRDSESAFRLTPGVQFNKGGPDSNVVTIRGVGTQLANSAVQNTTGIYIEDVPFTDPFVGFSTPDIAPFDLQRIEILRGPQGALYGSSSLGGAIRYIFNRPDLRQVQGSVLTNINTVSGGGIGGSAYAMINAPISTDVAGVRAVVFRRHDAGYIDNGVTKQKDTNSLDQSGGRFMLGLSPSKDWKILGLFQIQDTKVGDASAVSPDRNELSIDTAARQTYKSRWSLASVQIDGDIGNGLRFSSNTARLTKNRTIAPDATRSLAVLALPNPITVNGDSNGDAVSQEFRISSAPGAPLAFVVGAFYQRFNVASSYAYNSPGSTATYGAGLIPNDQLLTSGQVAKTTETAVFADGEYAITDKWSLGAGLRAYQTKLKFRDIFALSPLFGGTAGDAQDDTKDTGTTPKVSLKYKWNDDSMAYVLASRGYRFGGTNVLPPPSVPFKSDSLWNYETGLRVTPIENLALDASLFWIDWKDVQLQVNEMVNGLPFVGIKNAASARVKGAEVAARYRQGPVSIGISGAYTDARTTSDFVTGTSAPITVKSGTRLPGTAYFQAAIIGGLQFTGPANTNGHATLSISRVGKRVGNTIDDPAEMPAYTTADARVSFSMDRWELALFVENLSDARAVVAVSKATGPNGDYTLLRPRTVGASLRYDF